MTEIILHHYQGSPFAEKIKLFLGYKKLSWKSVLVPVTLPRPHLCQLTGGNRRTPVLQLNADIYCDTRLIMKVLDRLSDTPSQLVEDPLSYAISHWFEPGMFTYFSALRFQSEDDVLEIFKNKVEPLKFLEDRTPFLYPFLDISRLAEARESAMIHIAELANFLESQLSKSGGEFLLGDTPNFADFSAFHPFWWLKQSPARHDFLFEFERLWDWVGKLEGIGYGDWTEITEHKALEIVAQCTRTNNDDVLSTGLFQLGEQVKITPIDYGKDSVVGELIYLDRERVSVRKHSNDLGEINIHFPTWGYTLESPLCQTSAQ